jgi:nucleotide-binding universal stress UspA family protein
LLAHFGRTLWKEAMPASAAAPILCGTDFSEAAIAAANVSAGLAQRADTKLVLAHSLDERDEIPHHHRPALVPPLRTRLAQEAQRVRALGVEVEERLVDGVPNHGLVALAEECGARLIVVASSGKGALSRWMLGSVAERIAETATRPTLIVHDALPFEKWLRENRALKVFAAADFTANSEAALRWVAEWRQLAPCEIALGFVDLAPAQDRDLEYELRAEAERHLGGLPENIWIQPAETRIGAQLLKLASAASAELIVSGTHQWQGASRLAHASISRQLLRNAKVNFVCVPLRSGP